jgi:hypothetical protein
VRTVPAEEVGRVDIQPQYALARWLRGVTAEDVTGWIERPHLLQPQIVGIAEDPEVVDRQTNGTHAWLNLAVWVSPSPRLAHWPVAVDLPGRPLWLLTTWTDDPGLQHLLTALAVTETLEDLLRAWPAAAASIPLDSQWLDEAGRQLLLLTAAKT